jgi:sortase A
MFRRILGSILVVIGLGSVAWWGYQMRSAHAFQREQTVTFTKSIPRAAEPGASLATPYATIVPPHGPVGRLDIPRVHLSVMILEGDDDATLAKAVGHLPDTVMPWERGNSAVAGHRDTFFRPLKDVREGDEVRVTTAEGPLVYRITDKKITTPDDVQVLAPTTNQVLTLVTCYPFYYIGSAPKRMIIRAERVQGGP